jgi:MFS family permease
MAVRTDRNLHLLFASLFFWSFGVGLYDALLPIYARQLGASPVWLGTLYTLRHLALAAGFLTGWLVADRFHQRLVIGASWILSTPVPLLLAAAPSYGWLLPGLLLYEFGYFGLPAVHAYITRRVPPSELASTFGIMGTITSSGFVIAPTVGGFVADQWGIRATLLLAAVFYVASTILMLRVGHEGAPAPAGASAVPTAAEMRPLWAPMWIYAGATLVILITNPFLTPYLREVRGLTLSEIGFQGSMVAVGGVTLTIVAGRLGDRFGISNTLAAALLFFALGLLMVVVAPVALLPVLAVMRTRSPLFNLGHALIGARAPAATVGRAFAMAGALSALIAAAGALVGGYAYDVNPVLPLAISVGVAVALAAGLLAWPAAPAGGRLAEGDAA